VPHVNIKHFPRDFTDEQKKAVAEAITTVVLQNFDTYEGAVSIALEPVAKPDWNETVVVPEITGRAHLLVKAPNYGKQ
jgi:4-oxalocrotonate tautomerase